MRATELLIVSLLAGCVPDSRAALRTTIQARLHQRVASSDDSADISGLLAQPLGPDEAARVALLHNPRAQAAFDELGIASANLLADSVLPNPELDTETRLGRDRGGGDEIEAHVVVDVTALITLPLRRAAAEAELEAAQLQSAHEVLGLAYRTRSAFVRYQAALEERALEETVVASTRASFEAAHALHEAGNVPAIDEVLEQGLYEESRLALADAEIEVLDRREELQVLMGLSGPKTDWQPQPQLAAPPAEEESLEALEERAITQSLMLAEAEQRLIGLARRHGVARAAGLVPDLRAGISGSLADQIVAVGPAIAVTLPLFDQGLANADRIEAMLLVERRNFLATAIEVRSAVRRARNRILNARARATFVQGTLLPVRQRALQETLLQYNAMAATPFQLLSVRRDQIGAARSYVRARRDYWLARAALDQILAGGDVDAEQEDGGTP